MRQPFWRMWPSVRQGTRAWLEGTDPTTRYRCYFVSTS
jgi:hypothetical protein